MFVFPESVLLKDLVQSPVNIMGQIIGVSTCAGLYIGHSKNLHRLSLIFSLIFQKLSKNLFVGLVGLKCVFHHT